MSLYSKWVQYEVFFGLLNRWFALRVGLLSVFMGFFIVFGVLTGVFLGYFKETVAAVMLTLSLRFEESLIWLVRYLSTLESSLVPLQKIQNDMHLEEEGVSHFEKFFLKISSGHILFQNLYVRYEKSSPYVLENFSAKVLPSQINLLVGRTGCGKSTLIQALLRGVEIEKGSILLDGEDLHKYSLFSLREQMAYVPQEPLLFSWSLRKNIDIKEKYSDEDILKTISFLKLEAWFQKFPEGLETFLK